MWPIGLLFHYRHRFFIALLLHLHKRIVMSMFYFSFMHNSLNPRPPFLIDAFIIFKLLSLRRSIWGLMMSSSWWIPQLPPECWSFLVQLYLELFLSSWSIAAVFVVESKYTYWFRCCMWVTSHYIILRKLPENKTGFSGAWGQGPPLMVIHAITS